MIELKTENEIAALREAGRVVARVLQAVRAQAAVGTSLLELDTLAADLLSDAGAKSSFLHYHPGFAPSPYPAVLCTSVNDAVVHGIPTDYRLADGDLLSVDFGASVDGWHGDSAISFVVGDADPADLRLIETTEQALAAGIEQAKPGNHLGDVAHPIGVIGRRAGYGLLADHGGHGVGRAMHEAPHVPNEGPAGKGMRLRPGLVLAIEPMFIAGGRDEYRYADDGWTIHSIDGTRAAHVEHTIAVTDEGPRILTAL
ncbi:methionyl aminopeptidase [Amycolatopsis bartoniae]|uniref:Methionine aminopeptidase n=1 Tax=Amycolatopsis bartoniae TaxID=941986 RepID=A0A8H9M958_9PSEU|nr:type I methionyl aminopeptidase [Amycolatopsis bartoniae]MBB2934504.1 methionyl aminopeptidase [Amycolatopsis bartoniae]TVT01882.1 type I methionyl aminopeptidase [Amycolatopsis bartoniae]GHF46904.1 methionine aminopeptidase [Amycolatopsis bartoniae]